METLPDRYTQDGQMIRQTGTDNLLMPLEK